MKPQGIQAQFMDDFCFVHVAKLEKGCLMKKTKLNANRGGKRTKTLSKKSENVTEH